MHKGNSIAIPCEDIVNFMLDRLKEAEDNEWTSL